MFSKMRVSTVFAILVVGFTAGLLLKGLWTPALAQGVARPLDSPTLLMLSGDATDGGQNIVLIAPSDRVMSTYHIDAANGGISLRSVRNFRWDMMMDEFNSGEPKPKEIRALLEQN